MNTISNIGVHHAGGLGTDNFASTLKLTVDHINRGHKNRWPDFPSDIKDPVTGIPYYVGYNFVITSDGKITQCRLIGAETAAQVGHNFDTISICVVGNFMKKSNGQPVDVMTVQQISALKGLLTGLLGPNAGFYKTLAGTKLNLSLSRIYPHRVLQPNHTDCYGTFYPDDWARQLAIVVPEIITPPKPTTVPEIKPIATPEDVQNLLSWFQQIQLLWMKIQDIFAKKRFGREQLGARKSGRSCEGNINI